MTYFSGSLYFYGGRDQKAENDNRLYIYDFSSKTWRGVVTTNPPIMRTLYGVLNYNNSLYVLPGWDEVNDIDVGEIKRLDLKSTSYTWETLEVDSESEKLTVFPRDSYAYATNGSKVYIICGYTEFGLTNSFVELDFSNE